MHRNRLSIDGQVPGPAIGCDSSNDERRIDGTHDLDFGTNEGTYSLSSGGSVGAAGGTCAATYCHSQGLDWSAYAHLMVHPYTVEMVLVPAQTSCWRKIFSANDGSKARR